MADGFEGYRSRRSGRNSDLDVRRRRHGMDVKENEYSGTFDGAMGTFTCTAQNNGCRARHGRRRQDNRRDRALHSRLWTLRLTSRMPTTCTTASGCRGRRTQTARSPTTRSRPSPVRRGWSRAVALLDVKGSATYEGGATGVYVKSVSTRRWHRRIGHLRPLHGGRQPDGYLRSGGQNDVDGASYQEPSRPTC